MTRSRGIRGKRTKWTLEMEDRLRMMYCCVPNICIAHELGVDELAVFNKARYMGLQKTVVISRYQPGHVPYVTGKEMADIMSPEKYERFKNNFFKAGRIAKHAKPLGHEFLNDQGYILVKVSMKGRRYKLKHRVIWEEANGPIPKGCIVEFKDKDKSNCKLENLYLISRAEQLKTENSVMAKYPVEMYPIIALRGHLTRQIKKKENGEKGNTNRTT